jgi:hypothetical protein
VWHHTEKIHHLHEVQRGVLYAVAMAKPPLDLHTFCTAFATEQWPPTDVPQGTTTSEHRPFSPQEVERIVQELLDDGFLVESEGSIAAAPLSRLICAAETARAYPASYPQFERFARTLDANQWEALVAIGASTEHTERTVRSLQEKVQPDAEATKRFSELVRGLTEVGLLSHSPGGMQHPSALFQCLLAYLRREKVIRIAD